MIVVDSSALIAIVKRESDARSFVDIFASGSAFVMSAATLQEAMIVMIRGRLDTSDLDDLLRLYGISIVPVDEPLARLAADAFRQFGRGQGYPAKLNFGDCFAYALAKARDLPLLFKGDDFSRTGIRDARIALA